MSGPPPRSARIVLVTPDGRTIGALAPLPIATPWWQDVEPVVWAVRARYGAEITVLRLLEVGEPGPDGVEVTYVAETPEQVAAEPWGGVLDEQPLRMAYARPGGPAADLAWAEGVLADHGLVRTGPPAQVRTWNLSSLWRIPLDGQTAWLKVVPPFFAHEGPLVQRLAGSPVPRLFGHDGSRMLMPEIPGQDLYEAPEPLLLRMIDLLVELQRAWIGRIDALLPLGLPDWRGPVLIPAAAAVIERNAGLLTAEDRRSLDAFMAGLSQRFTDLGACGLPDTLVHGDFHPGNLRGDAHNLTLLDWGDGGIGHPLLDQSAFLTPIAEASVEPVRDRWHKAWRAAATGSDPDRASALIAPIDAMRRAVIYQDFLDNIEPSEHPYHRADPPDWLARTAALVRAEAGSAR